jgi:putative toxin-antitoxin system antitoxin component (TIGR02293 family)
MADSSKKLPERSPNRPSEPGLADAQPAKRGLVAINAETDQLVPGKPGYRSVVQASGKGALSFKGDTSEMIKAMRMGTPASVVPDLAIRFGMSQDRLFEVLRLPRSTMKGRINKNEMLSASEQDRMYRADRVWSRAVAVLEDEGAARSWLGQNNRSLGGEAPLSLLDTEVGYELVLDTLGRIEYGVVS